MGFDLTMVSVGEFGKYQRRVFALLCLVGIPFSFFDTGPVLWAYIPEYQCGDSHLINHKQQRKNTLYTSETDRMNTDERNGSLDVTNEVDGDNWVDLWDLFTDSDNERCFLSSRNTDEPRRNEGQYCANYTFEATGTTIVARVSTTDFSLKIIYLCMITESITLG